MPVRKLAETKSVTKATDLVETPPHYVSNVKSAIALLINLFFHCFFLDPLSKVDIVPRQEAKNAGEMIKCIANGNPFPKITFQPSGKTEVGDGWTSLIIKEEWVSKKQEIM